MILWWQQKVKPQVYVVWGFTSATCLSQTSSAMQISCLIGSALYLNMKINIATIYIIFKVLIHCSVHLIVQPETNTPQGIDFILSNIYL